MEQATAPPSPPDGYLRTTDLISALSAAADLALGLPADHAARACWIALAIAADLGLPEEQCGELYYTTLLLDAGCTAFASMFAEYIGGDEIVARQELFFARDAQGPLELFDWSRQYLAAGAPLPQRIRRLLDFAVHGQDMFREGFRNTCEVSQRFAQRLGMPSSVQHALLHVFEHWDGGGMPSGSRREAIPITARIAQAAMFLEIRYRGSGARAAVQLARDRRGTSFDPAVVDAFIAAADRPGFWKTLEQASVREAVRSLEPPSPIRFVRREKLLDIALFAADFADLKSGYTTGHSRRVAQLAAGIARRLALSEPVIDEVRLAALFHDLGLVAVPSFVLDKPLPALTQTEAEAMRLHPYHAERIVARVPTLAGVATIVGAHHERIDGGGYYRGLAGVHIPLGARIIAVADAFDDLTHERAGRPALDAAAAIDQMRAEVGRAYDADAFAALLKGDELAWRVQNRHVPRPSWPAGLDDARSRGAAPSGDRPHPKANGRLRPRQRKHHPDPSGAYLRQDRGLDPVRRHPVCGGTRPDRLIRQSDRSPAGRISS